MSGVDDRTRHVIDAIDGALNDWTIGPDAMRWTPEPAELVGGPLPPLRRDRRDGSWPRRPVDRFSIAPAGTDPRDGEAWTEIGHLVDDVRLTPWQGAVLAETFGSAFREAAAAMSQLFAVSAEELERMAATLVDLHPLPPEEPEEPEEPRARALRLRQQRNTGPPRDLTRQRRPRRLP